MQQLKAILERHHGLGVNHQNYCLFDRERGVALADAKPLKACVNLDYAGMGSRAGGKVIELQVVPKVALQVSIQVDQQQLNSQMAKIAKKTGLPGFASGTTRAADPESGPAAAASMVPTDIRTGFALNTSAADDLSNLNVPMGTGLGLVFDPHPLLRVAGGERAIDIISEEMSKGDGSAGWCADVSKIVQAAQTEVLHAQQGSGVVVRNMPASAAFGWVMALQEEREEKRRRKANANRKKPKKAFKGLEGGFFGSVKEKKKLRKQNAARVSANAAVVAQFASASADASAKVAKKAAKPKRKKKFKDLMKSLTQAEERGAGQPSPRTRGRAQLLKANPRVVSDKFDRV
jgi:hypothetical protein